MGIQQSEPELVLFRILQQNVSAFFTNCLQQGYNAAEISHVKHGEFKIDITEMPHTLIDVFATCLTWGIFSVCSLQLVGFRVIFFLGVLTLSYQTFVQDTKRHRGAPHILIVQIFSHHMNVRLLLDTFGTFNTKTQMRAEIMIITCRKNVFLTKTKQCE